MRLIRPISPIKILTIVGPTSSGKSEMAVLLAKKLNGEIISCDSRQIYKGMDLGTGKIPGRWITSKIDDRQKVMNPVRKKFRRILSGRSKSVFIYKSVSHHLIDFVSPHTQFSVARFKILAQKAIADILARGKLPILCGGTGHWIDAVIFDQSIPDVKPNAQLRKKLEKLSTQELFHKLMKLDKHRADTIDKHNKRRLIRALEIIITTGKPVPASNAIPNEVRDPLSVKINNDKRFLAKLGMEQKNILWIGINSPQDILYKKIDARLRQRIRQGMIAEVVNLHSPSPLARGDAPKGQRGRKMGLSWRKLESFGLEYRYVAKYLQTKISYDEMLKQLSFAIKHFAKRQITWWKRNKNIKWFANANKTLNFSKKMLT
jgi:tRNA dimethylallyltransferase